MQASKLKKLHKSRESLPRQSQRVMIGDINLVAKRAVRLGLCPEGWLQDSSITINHPDGRKSKAGLTRARVVKNWLECIARAVPTAKNQITSRW
ncbi:hypothetical protein RUA4292_00581 [Ruegeria atlantica]|uniref:Uncharacterized protein n=1 Tax=Ruegeria atlantica TaxID=81569 RepID=A0A0P1EAL0_9RHOB|nr:hypothetical protein RUA4292_00581 [Ruegeria atlantica]